MNKLVILSAGHNPGKDSGAVGQGVYEADANVRICNRISVLLQTWGLPVVYMPNNVGDLTAEIAWVNARYKSVYDGLAVQVHLNAGGGTGTETWVPSYPDAESIKQGTIVNNALVASLGLRNRGVKQAQNNQWGKLGWTDDTNTYAILCECYFIDVDSVSHDQELKAAYGIAAGLCQYFGVPVGKTPEQIAAEAAAKAAADAALAAKAAADAAAAKLAAEAAKVQAEADAAAEAKRLADEAAAKALADKLAAEKAVADAANTENLNILQIIFKALKDFITAILAKKG